MFLLKYEGQEHFFWYAVRLIAVNGLHEHPGVQCSVLQRTLKVGHTLELECRSQEPDDGLDEAMSKDVHECINSFVPGVLLKTVHASE